MTMNSSGSISLAGTTSGISIEIENGGNGTSQISLNDAAVRTLAKVSSGAITMPSDFWGKSNRVSISYTFTSHTTNASLNLSALGGYSSGKSDITVTVNAGVYLWANGTGSYGLTLSGSTSGDTVYFVNNGYIMGCGGQGGLMCGDGHGAAGSPGGSAMNIASIGVSGLTINQTNGSAYIGGGGGGGGRGFNYSGAGGGAGGGNGSKTCVPCCGTGGGIGAYGANGGAASQSYSYGDGCTGSFSWGDGGGGGRIFPGSGGGGGGIGQAGAGGGAGGGGGGGASCMGYNNPGGAGGSSNNAGQAGKGQFYMCNGAGGGGGWGASGGSGYRAGGAGGKAINTGGKSITWVSGVTARVWGSVS